MRDAPGRSVTAYPLSLSLFLCAGHPLPRLRNDQGFVISAAFRYHGSLLLPSSVSCSLTDRFISCRRAFWSITSFKFGQKETARYPVFAFLYHLYYPAGNGFSGSQTRLGTFSALPNLKERRTFLISFTDVHPACIPGKLLQFPDREFYGAVGAAAGRKNRFKTFQ